MEAQVELSDLNRILLTLARSRDFPDGSSRHGYDFIAPLDPQAHIDPVLWRKYRGYCRVRRFWEGEDDEIGYLIHKPGGAEHGRWVFTYSSDDDDERSEKQRATKNVRLASVAGASAERTGNDGKKTIVIDLEETLKGAMRAIGGSRADDWNEVIANQAVNTVWKSGNENTDSQRQNGVLSALICMKPRDEFEGMLFAQMIAVQNAAMECYKRAMVPGQIFQWHEESLNQANKLSRTFVSLLEALNRHRGKGQQKMVVEHVHVHSGGQAVVGVVESPGGRGQREPGNQPHAVGYAELASVRSKDKERDAMPVSGNG